MADIKPVDVPAGVVFEDLPKADGLDAYKAETDKKLADIEQLTKYILWVGLISLVAVIVAVTGLVIDQIHFNNQTYRQENNDRVQLLQDEINNLKAK